MPRRSVSTALFQAALVAAACGVGGVAARADTIQVTTDSAAYGYDQATLNETSFAFPAPSYNNPPLSQVRAYTGADYITGKDASTGASFSAIAFCVDLKDYLQNPPYSYTQAALGSTISDATKQTQVAALVTNGTNLLVNGTLPDGTSVVSSSSGDYQLGGNSYSKTQVSSALQIAVWTAEYQTGSTNNGDGGYSAGMANSGFWVSNPSNSGDVTLADLFLGDVTGGGWTPLNSAVELSALSPSANQNLSYYDYAGSLTVTGVSPVPAPEPAALSIVATGLLGLLAVRRRRGA